MCGRMELSGKLNTRLYVFACILVLMPVASRASDSSRINVIFIAVDDLKPTLGCYGDTLAISPNLDAIAARGTVFSASYCQQAVCAPSRASLLTGRYPDQLRVWDLQTQLRELNPGIVSLPQYLRKFGYETAATGKVFDPRSVDDARDQPSWSIPYRGPWDIKYYDEAAGRPAAYFYASPEAKDTIAMLEAEARSLGVDEMEYVREHYFPPTERADVPEDAYTDGAIVNAGIELLEELAAGDAPFFLAVGFNRPHLPFNAPAPFWDLYDRNLFSLAPYREKAIGSPDIGYHNSDELRSYTGVPRSGSIQGELQLELIHGYYAAVSYIDHLIGLLVQRVDELGLTEQTAIVVWGDHGWHLGDHDLWCKHSNFEQATRSPLIIAVPEQANAGSIATSPTEFTDIAPTLCEITALPIPAYFEGESLLPLMADPMSTIREGSLSQYPRGSRMGYSLRTTRYRYTKWVNGDGSFYEDELYDYQTDPLETRDFSDDSSYEKVIAHLDSLLDRRIAHPSTQHKVLFQVRGLDKQGDTMLITEAKIRFEDAVPLTGSRGTTLVTHPLGNFPYQVEADGYDSCSGMLSIRGDTTVQIFLGHPDVAIHIHSVNDYTGEAVQGALTTLNGTGKVTDSEGLVQIAEKQGSYQLRVEHPMYDPWEGTVHIGGDTAMTIRLTPAFANIRFVLLEGSIPVANTPVMVNGVEYVTNSWGIARSDTVETREHYPWTIDKEGYVSKSGSIYLVADTTVSVQMESLVPVTDHRERHDLLCWPNPVTDLIHLEFAGGGAFQLTICTASGRRVFSRRLQGNRCSIDLRFLDKGAYLMIVTTRTTTLVRKILKI